MVPQPPHRGTHSTQITLYFQKKIEIKVKKRTHVHDVHKIVIVEALKWNCTPFLKVNPKTSSASLNSSLHSAMWIVDERKVILFFLNKQLVAVIFTAL